MADEFDDTSQRIDWQELNRERDAERLAQIAHEANEAGTTFAREAEQREAVVREIMRERQAAAAFWLVVALAGLAMLPLLALYFGLVVRLFELAQHIF